MVLMFIFFLFVLLGSAPTYKSNVGTSQLLVPEQEAQNNMNCARNSKNTYT